MIDLTTVVSEHQRTHEETVLQARLVHASMENMDIKTISMMN